MRFPYGEANFHKIRTEGYFYVDKTRYLEIVEQSPESHLVVLRSRRFGKSLFVNMLGWYYDQQHAELFETLFKGTYIYDHPTPKRHSYMMLTFNFSGINTETLENANAGFTFEVRSSVGVFLERYHEHFSRQERERIAEQPTPNDTLTALFHAIARKGLGKCVYVTIDEYDHFANNILSQGKQMFHDLVRTDGYIRPFYEALKKGTETVVDHIFITGVLPILLDSLTSGFNIGMNVSTDRRFNTMFGFTEDEIAPILAYLGDKINREEIRAYYNGYRFSPDDETTVYNSDMILYYALKYPREGGRLRNMIDPNVVSDYRKIRAILSIGDQEIEETVLTRIVRDRRVELKEISQMFILTRETEFLFTEETILSLMFYMGYLTIAGVRGIRVELAMPNLVLESLYLDYMQHLLMQRGNLRLGSRDQTQMLQALVDGDLAPLIALTEQFLKGLSNRDYQQFDEKYIKVVMLSLLSDVNIYIPHSEYEVRADGYVDLYLQAAFQPQQSAHYFIELKYAKARAAKQTLDRQAQEGAEAMSRYLDSPSARAIPNLRAYVLVFCKDRCVRRLACHPSSIETHSPA